MNKKILIIRFSALGDVTMAIHLINALIQQNAGLEIFFLSKPQFYPLVKDLNVKIIDNDLKGKYKGIVGLYKLSREIAKNDIELIADIHGVIRSYIIDFFMLLRGRKVKIIKKDRKKKKLIIKGKNIPIKHSFDRYIEVIKKLNIPIEKEKYKPNFAFRIPDSIIYSFLDKSKKNIGIAPFAAHKTKQYPLENMEEVIEELDKTNKYQILIFGGGKKEKEKAQQWEQKYKNVKSLIGKLPIYQEVGIIKDLDAIVTMDSGNMHLASLVQTPNIIIWGGTHPKMGFTPVKNYNPSLSLIKNLDCQPCSVFGTDHCKRDDYACLYQILPSEIIEKIEQATK